jgi:hypothetical protein
MRMMVTSPELHGEPVNPVSRGMVIIVTQFLVDPDQDVENRSEGYNQSEYIYKMVEYVPPQRPENVIKNQLQHRGRDIWNKSNVISARSLYILIILNKTPGI